jgi:hypothetical protein
VNIIIVRVAKDVNPHRSRKPADNETEGDNENDEHDDDFNEYGNHDG